MTAPVPAGSGHALVTGGAGFIGCNLADRLAAAGRDVLVLDNLARAGADANLAWLRRRHPRRVRAVTADIRDDRALRDAVRGAGVVFHLAAQVAVTTSIQDPLADFDVNLRGTVLLLDAVRRRPGGPVPLVFASTNKVFGDLSAVPLTLADGAWQPADPALRAHGVGAAWPLDFHTPYGCSKGGADQYVLDAARSFAVPAVVLRMSCIYGTRQRGTEDQGWVAHFARLALAGAPVTLFGDGRQVRDVLFVDDAVDAYLAAGARADTLRGRAFALGGGPGNAVSLLAMLEELGRQLGRAIQIRFAAARPGDQRWFVADRADVEAALGLAAPLPWRDGLARLLSWLADEKRPAEAAA